MKSSFFVAAVFAITFGVLTGLGLILGIANTPRGEVIVTQLPDDGGEPVKVARVEFRPQRPY